MKRQSAMEALQDDGDERDLEEVMHLRRRGNFASNPTLRSEFLTISGIHR